MVILLNLILLVSFHGDATSTFQIAINTKTYQVSCPGGKSVIVVPTDFVAGAMADFGSITLQNHA